MRRRTFLVTGFAAATGGCLNSRSSSDGTPTKPTEQDTPYPQAQTDTFVRDETTGSVEGPAADSTEGPTVRSTPTPEHSAAVALSFGEWYTPEITDFAWTVTGVTVTTELWIPSDSTTLNPPKDSAIAFGKIRAKNISQSASSGFGIGLKNWAFFTDGDILEPKKRFKYQEDGYSTNAYPVPYHDRDNANLYGYFEEVASGQVVDLCYPVVVPTDTEAESLVPAFHDPSLETDWGARWYRE